MLKKNVYKNFNVIYYIIIYRFERMQKREIKIFKLENSFSVMFYFLRGTTFWVNGAGKNLYDKKLIQVQSIIFLIVNKNYLSIKTKNRYNYAYRYK